MAKIKVATTWLDSCSGCHMSFLDMDEALIELANRVEFSRSPITDIKEFSPVDVGIGEGAVGNDEEEETVKELRANCKILVAVGDCACFGGPPSMRNSLDVKDVLQRCYVETESTVKDGTIPSGQVPRLLERVKTVNQVVKVDCYIPGCPPSADAIHYTLSQLLQGKIPVLPSEQFRYELLNRGV